MKKRITAIALCMAISASTVATGVYADNKFNDVAEKNWFYNAVEYVSEKGLMAGISDTEFAPANSVNKAMLVATLHRNEGYPKATNKPTFEDLPQNAYYTEAAYWAVENGILSGVRENVLGIGWEITREEVAAILHRYAQYKGITDESSGKVAFVDDSDISGWAKNSVSFCREYDILQGDKNNNFMPKSTFTRAELAQVLMNAFSQSRQVTVLPEKVKNGAKAAAVFMHDDGGKATGRLLVKLMPKYNINGTVSIIGKSIDPEYNVNEPDNFEKWQVIIGDSDGRLNFAVHSHGHRYLGETDEAESGVLSDGTEFSYEKGHMTFDIASERERINQMFPEERLLAFVKPGTLWPDGKEQVSQAAKDMIKEHYIAMRNTGGGADTLPPEDVYSVKSIMARSADSYNATEDNQTSDFLISQLDDAVNKNGVIVYLFHNISEDSGALGNSAGQVRVEMLFDEMEDRIAKGEIWNGKFDEVMQYTQEYNAITKTEAVSYPFDGKITVSVSDSISKIDTDLTNEKFACKDMFDYPITVKTELKYDWEYVKVSQSYNDRYEIVKPFEEEGRKFVYANVVPDEEAAVLTEAKPDEYVEKIYADGTEIENFCPAKFYYKVTLPEGTTSAPVISCENKDAVIEQAELDENGEGSAFVKLGSLCYEIYFCTEKDGKTVLLKINPENDDENLTATVKMAEILASFGITANITDKSAYEKLSSKLDNVAFLSDNIEDNIEFEFDDEETEKAGDFAPCYRYFAKALAESEGNEIVMTIHPENKGDLYFSVIKDQIKYLLLNDANFVTSEK